MTLPDYDWCPICEKVTWDGFDDDARACVSCAEVM